MTPQTRPGEHLRLGEPPLALNPRFWSGIICTSQQTMIGGA